MSIQHHPDISTLMSYAAGGLGEALSAVVIAHIVRCPACRADLRRLEAIGATVFSQTSSVPVGEAPAVSTSAAERVPRPGDRIPDPLGIVLAGGLSTFRWRWLGPGVHHHRLPLSAGAAGDLRLLKIAPGQKMPAHGHGGSELTLVLEGAYHDETGRFGPGAEQLRQAEAGHAGDAELEEAAAAEAVAVTRGASKVDPEHAMGLRRRMRRGGGRVGGKTTRG